MSDPDGGLREAAIGLGSYVICSRKRNTDDFLEGLAERVNELAEVAGLDQRFGWDAKADSFKPIEIAAVRLDNRKGAAS